MVEDRMPRVLIVDDDRDHAFLLELSLQSFDFEVYAAHSCAEARRVLEEQPVDAMIVDFELGDGDGADLVSSLGERRPETTILLSGRDLSMNDEARAAFDAFFVKPAAIHRLARAISSTSEWRSSATMRAAPVILTIEAPLDPRRGAA